MDCKSQAIFQACGRHGRRCGGRKEIGRLGALVVRKQPDAAECDAQTVVASRDWATGCAPQSQALADRVVARRLPLILSS